MNINFPPVDARFIQTAIKDGYYTNATELVRDAVRRMRQSYKDEKDKHERLMVALEAGEASIREHGTVPYTPEFLDECEQRARENVAKGVRPNPDVCP